jgi:predicted methyltransferase
VKTALCAALLGASILAAPAFAAMAPAGGMPAAAPAPITAERPAGDVARDANRKPNEIIAFAGVKPGMTVAELGAGGGYYTRMLSKAVGPNGKVYAIVTQAQVTAGRTANLEALAKVLGNVQVVPVASMAAIKTPTPADLFWTTENYHDFHNNGGDIAGLNKAVFDALKPGGVFYVEDHSAAKGAGLAATASVHRMDEDVAKTELAAAGFRIDAETNLLRNPMDNKTGANAESGSFNSDRFGLRAKKPG